MLWRHPVQQAVWQLAAASLRGFRRVLDGKGFTEIQTPKIVGTSTESGANVFALDYFGKRGYLAQSPQFYKQMLVGSTSGFTKQDRSSGLSRTTRYVTLPSMSRWMSSSVSSITTATF